MEGTGSVYCPVINFGITAFETSGSATSLLVRLLVGYIIFCN